MKVFAALYAWRDNIARKEDESTRYVLPNHIMFEIASQMPSDTVTLLSCCNPVPPLVRQHSDTLIQLITRTKTAQPTPTAPVPVPTPAPEPVVARPVPVFYPSSQPRSISPPQPIPQKFNVDNTFTPVNQVYPISTHNNTPSPVLTTEQLYKTAGWLTEDEPDQDFPFVSNAYYSYYYCFVDKI